MSTFLVMDNTLNTGGEAKQVHNWGQMIRAAQANPAAGAIREAVVAQAREVLALPLVRRVYKLEDVGQHRTWLDGRSNTLGPEIKETFALAMSDHATNRLVGEEMPVLAAAWLLTGEAHFKKRLLAQLEEVATWSPLQRPGWTCYHAKAKLPADGKDGSWLATGTGVRAIGTVLDIVDGETIPASLVAKLHAQLEAEIQQITGDWKARRQWFVRGKNVLTNQWVLPTEGLVRACLILGKEKHAEAYEMGVANLLLAIDAHGEAGEFEEGLDYASFTVTSIFHAAHAMAVNGDERAINCPFLKRFCLWAVHHLMPGGFGINAFDAFASGIIKRDCKHVREILGAGVVFAGDPYAAWALTHLLDGPLKDVVGLAATAGMAELAKEPALFATYQRATRVNWRSSWEENATGLWVRGGHATDQHDHEDRGHVSFILHGKPVFIETGTPAYHHPELGRWFASGAGHNVLQVGLNTPPAGENRPVVPGWQKRGTVAGIVTHKLDAQGGHVSVDVSAGYEDVARWERDVHWDLRSLMVRDYVTLKQGMKEVLLFRWHLGVQEDVIIDVKQRGRVFQVAMPDAMVTITSSTPLVVAQEKRESHSLVACGWDDPIPYPRHVCLMVKSVEPVEGLDVVMDVREV